MGNGFAGMGWVGYIPKIMSFMAYQMNKRVWVLRMGF